MNLIDKALADGRSALSEYESKRLLSSFGIPVTHEVIARNAAEAVSLASELGFPVVLKASGAGISHKTEVGGVALNLGTELEVKKEGERLLRIEGAEGLLVQEMVKGARELVCGLMRDSGFGVCVMFGIGGVLTEIIEDIVFRIAPLTRADCAGMISQIRGRKIVEPFRGEAAVDLDVLCKTLMALGEIGLQHKEVTGVDINPMTIRPNGQPVAVDALVTLNAGSPVSAK